LNKIKAAVTMRITSETEYEEIRDSISKDLITFLEKQQIIPILIPNNSKLAWELIDDTDILIISGGNDIIEKQDTSDSNFDKEVHTRTVLEMELIKHFISKSKPIFGICHGLQLINNYFNGSLVLLNSRNHISSEHNVKLKSKRNLWFGAQNLQVNSYHNYAISKLGEGLDSFAESSDGIIEGLCHRSEKIMAVMWHPERSFSDDNSQEFNKNIIIDFLQAIQ
tara:strand:- start:350 stop:1018 length:669 start_codon:yes stop_codon:yes gene_type:complete